MSRNCPNCGAPLDDNYCKCPYCGTLYYDLTVLDDEVPCYVKFRTAMGTITTYAKPELKEINTWRDSVDVTDVVGHRLASYYTSVDCNIDVIFHPMVDWSKNNKPLYTIDTGDRK